MIAGARVLTELEPVVERLLERHLANTKEWFPHQLVPWSQARDFEPDWEWTPEESDLEPAVRSALFVNLLTEDNLPYYSAELLGMFGGDGAWGEWGRRWTAEEGRHSIVMRDWLTAIRAIDPVSLERARMVQVSKGEIPHPGAPLMGLAYVTLQELATRLSHHNTGKRLDGVGYNVMKRVAMDENHHHLFYRDLTKEAINEFPSETMVAIEQVVREFAMPGEGIPGFAEMAKEIAREGIYDFNVHYENILKPVVLGHWKIESVEGLDAEGDQAREKLVKRIDRIAIAARRTKEAQERRAAEATETGDSPAYAIDDRGPDAADDPEGPEGKASDLVGSSRGR